MTMFDLLLRLYPASFRHEYGAELRAAFDQRRRTESGLGVAGLWLEAIADTCTAAATVHLDILRHDLSYAGRTLARAPGFAVVAVAIVALGIGATTAAFSVADFVLLRPLPFPQPSRLVKIRETTPGYAWMEFSAPNYRDWMGAAHSYESSGVYHEADVTLMTRGEPRRLSGVSVSADLFPTLGVAPRLGRTFTLEDDRPGAASTVILSDRFWKTEFGGRSE